MSTAQRPIWVLNVAEKPSVAKAVAEILSRRGRAGGFRTRDGRSRYNRVFEFDYAIGPNPCHMLVTSVTGHLMELDFDNRFRRWNSCDHADLFHLPVHKHVNQDKLDIKRTLEEEARKCQWLVLWLDCDREGENIAFEVMDVCTAVNARLNVWRARFSALIDREIHEAAQNLDRPNKLFADAVDTRMEIDLRIGAAFTRFQTQLLKDAYVLDFVEDGRNVVLSYGPCQFPTLGFIVERYWEIQAHEQEEFWTINCSHTSEEEISTFSWARGHIFDYTCAVIVYEMCIENPTATVMNVKHQEKLKYPPYPLSTVELQKRASRYFRMGAEHTMKIAEELYQAGFISYPRTETDSFSVNTDLNALVWEQVAHPVWGTYAQRLLDPDTRLWRNPGNGGHNDKAHPPIHPTKFSAGEPGWSQDKNRVYELVVRHFLACVSQPAVGAETTVDIDIAGEKFSASGRAILAKNYLDIYRFETWGGTIIPRYTIGQQFLPTSLTLNTGVTKPLPLLSEADLLSCMDKAGIGTDATMHEHIKKLLDRFYATKDSNTRFSPTSLGEALVTGYDEMGYELWKPYLRALMESDMKAVSIGAKRKTEVLDSCLQQMKACLLDARLKKVKLLEAMDLFFERSYRSGGDAHDNGQVVRPCGLCNESHMVLKRRLNGEFMVGCMSYPLCRNVVWLPGSLSEAVVTSNICPNCAPGPVYIIHFRFRRFEIPPDYDLDHLGCVGGCDRILKELIEICGTGSRHSTSIAAARGRVLDTTINRSRGNSRQERCSQCWQTGHSLNNCPFQACRSQAAQSYIHDSRNSSDQIICNSCGASCPLRTANTSSNRGRKFYSCASQECNFFVWEDNLDNGRVREGGTSSHRRSNRGSCTSTGRGTHGQRQRGAYATGMTFVSATGERLSGSCFVCGDPSHFANVCPVRDRSQPH